MNWREQIEARIDEANLYGWSSPAISTDVVKALLDVAVAADAVSKNKGMTLLGCAPENEYGDAPHDERMAHECGAYKAFNQCADTVTPALDKLRELRDE